jgi:hypothetical protein
VSSVLCPCGAPETKQGPGHWHQKAERVQKRLCTFELPLLIGTAGLECLEKLFDDPACTLGIDDEQHLLDVIDGLARREIPFNWLSAIGRIRFPDVNNVDVQCCR